MQTITERDKVHVDDVRTIEGSALNVLYKRASDDRVEVKLKYPDSKLTKTLGQNEVRTVLNCTKICTEELYCRIYGSDATVPMDSLWFHKVLETQCVTMSMVVSFGHFGNLVAESVEVTSISSHDT